MEYVEGLQIDRHCNVHKLTFTERLKLSCGVCAAVQYANQKLVVHGGLKVRNIIGTTGGVASRPWRWRHSSTPSISRKMPAGLDPSSMPMPIINHAVCVGERK